MIFKVIRKALVQAAVVTLLTALHGSAAQPCPGSTNCRATGHSTVELSPYPYTEDITAPTITLTGPASSWTPISIKCTGIPGNLNGTATFDAVLRAWILIRTASPATGNRYQFQFVVDGIATGPVYDRQLRGSYPYGDLFQSIAQNLVGSYHTLSIQMRLLGSGTMTIDQKWISAQGVTGGYPAGESTKASFSLGTNWTIISKNILFSNTSPVDISLQGSFRIAAGSYADAMWVGFSLDGQNSQRTSYVGITSSLPDGVNILDHLYNVPPGNHNLNLWGHTVSNPATLQDIRLHFVAFPHLIATGAQSVNSPILVTPNTTQAQPCWPGDGAGNWTKLLEFTVPPYGGFAPNYLLDGFIQFTGDLQGNSLAQVAIEAVTGNGQCQNPNVDFGAISIQVPSESSGVYPFGESLSWGDTTGNVLRLWIRPYGGGGSGGTFTVLNRYLGVTLLAANTCFFP